MWRLKRLREYFGQPWRLRSRVLEVTISSVKRPRKAAEKELNNQISTLRASLMEKVTRKLRQH